MTRRRVRLLLEAAGLLVVVGGLALLLGYVSDHPRNTLYASIPWRSGAFDQDPHWWTSFADLGLDGMADLRRMPPADPTLDPWRDYPGPPNISLMPGDGSGGWYITVGHGFVKVGIGETQFLYLDTVGLEDRLLRQGIAHGYLADMQRIYGERRDLTELATAVATND